MSSDTNESRGMYVCVMSLLWIVWELKWRPFDYELSLQFNFVTDLCRFFVRCYLHGSGHMCMLKRWCTLTLGSWGTLTLGHTRAAHVHGHAHAHAHAYARTYAYAHAHARAHVQTCFDSCCFYYLVRNSLVALLEALCARIFSWDLWMYSHRRVHTPADSQFVALQHAITGRSQARNMRWRTQWQDHSRLMSSGEWARVIYKVHLLVEKRWIQCTK